MSLSAALARKQRREEYYDVLIDDPTAAEAAVKVAERGVLDAALEHGADSDEVTAAQTQLAASHQQLADCYHRVVLRNLPPAKFEALVAAHKPTKAQEDAGAMWNRTTLAPALLAACAVDSDLTEEQWAEQFASGLWSMADRDGIFGAALAVNVSARDTTVPKG